MTYSCAFFEDGADETLEEAQARKLDLLATAAEAPGARRVLDIGCGWGSLLERLTSVHGVERAVGLTLSPEQAGAIERRRPPGCEVRVENWADHEPDGSYDAIISIGAFEHFARWGLPRAERVAAYRRFFERCRGWLRPGGRLALQTNAKGNNVRIDRQTAAELRFIAETIFPESELPWLSEIAEASERLFEVRWLRNDPDHYARTIAEWHRRLTANRDRAVECVGEPTTEAYASYLGTTVRHFERRHLALLRIAFERT
jgi:cyclopropane-fatty-acyl-phospholipid synthase